MYSPTSTTERHHDQRDAGLQDNIPRRVTLRVPTGLYKEVQVLKRYMQRVIRDEVPTNTIIIAAIQEYLNNRSDQIEEQRARE